MNFAISGIEKKLMVVAFVDSLNENIGNEYGRAFIHTTALLSL